MSYRWHEITNAAFPTEFIVLALGILHSMYIACYRHCIEMNFLTNLKLPTTAYTTLDHPQEWVELKVWSRQVSLSTSIMTFAFTISSRPVEAWWKRNLKIWSIFIFTCVRILCSNIIISMCSEIYLHVFEYMINIYYLHVFENMINIEIHRTRFRI